MVRRCPMLKLRTTREWYRWCIELGEVTELRDNVINHPHSLGEAWEKGLVDHYQDRIDDLRANEPTKKRLM